MKLPVTLFLLFISTFSFAQKPIVATVDQRVELISLVFRLAGNAEYNFDFSKAYVKDLNDHFGKYKTHPLILFAKELSEKGMGYSKVMFLAVRIARQNNRFSLIKATDNGLEGKWSNEDAEKFVTLLNDFYKVSGFDQFFSDHQSLYNEANIQFANAMTGFDQPWYPRYYGVKPGEDFKLVIGLANGGANYGPSVHPDNEKRIVYAIMGSWTYSEDGKPLFKKEDYRPIVIHEFNHSFINPILDQGSNEQKLKRSGEILIGALRKEMNLEGYDDWKSLINESLVRASVVRYMIDHKDDQKTVDTEILNQTNAGFIWINDLVTLLGKYESSRAQYPSFNDFYPQIISFFDATADRITQIKADYAAKQPKVTGMGPFKNNAQDVDASIQEINIDFDREVVGAGSIKRGESGREHLGGAKVLGYGANNRSCRVSVSLKPDMDYEFVLYGGKFKSAEGYSLQEYTVKFRTKK